MRDSSRDPWCQIHCLPLRWTRRHWRCWWILQSTLPWAQSKNRYRHWSMMRKMSQGLSRYQLYRCYCRCSLHSRSTLPCHRGRSLDCSFHTSLHCCRRCRRNTRESGSGWKQGGRTLAQLHHRNNSVNPRFHHHRNIKRLSVRNILHRRTPLTLGYNFPDKNQCLHFVSRLDELNNNLLAPHTLFHSCQ